MNLAGWTGLEATFGGASAETLAANGGHSGTESGACAITSRASTGQDGTEKDAPGNSVTALLAEAVAALDAGQLGHARAAIVAAHVALVGVPPPCGPIGAGDRDDVARPDFSPAGTEDLS